MELGAIITILLATFMMVVGWGGMVRVTKQHRSFKVKVLCYFMIGCVVLSMLFIIFIILGHYFRVI